MIDKRSLNCIFAIGFKWYPIKILCFLEILCFLVFIAALCMTLCEICILVEKSDIEQKFFSMSHSGGLERSH